MDKTHYLVLWSRIGNFDRGALDRVTYTDRRLLEHNAFYVPIERLPELRYEAGPWINRWDGVSGWIKTNQASTTSILDQLRVEVRSNRATSTIRRRQRLEVDRLDARQEHDADARIHGQGLEVLVSGREGQERLWDLPERVIPADAPTESSTRRSTPSASWRRRCAASALPIFARSSRAPTGWTSRRCPRADRPIGRGGPTHRGRPSGAATPGPRGRHPRHGAGRVTGSVASRTTFLSPFDPLIYDRDRTRELFDFSFKLEMYMPKDEREFGHFVLPVVHDGALVGRLDSERDRKTNELIVNKLHWEDRQPKAATRGAVDAAIAELAAFVRAG